MRTRWRSACWLVWPISRATLIACEDLYRLIAVCALCGAAVVAVAAPARLRATAPSGPVPVRAAPRESPDSEQRGLSHAKADGFLDAHARMRQRTFGARVVASRPAIDHRHFATVG